MGSRKIEGAPPNRRNFVSEWDEIVYLYHKLIHWFYGEHKVSRARPFARRLEKLLRRVASDHEAIMGEECWSLVYQLKGDLRRAIRYRESEIKLMERLLGTLKPELLKSGVFGDYSDLGDRFVLLASLHHQAGDDEEAVKALKHAKKLASRHGFAFESALYDELVGRPSTRSAPRAQRSRSRAPSRARVSPTGRSPRRDP